MFDNFIYIRGKLMDVKKKLIDETQIKNINKNTKIQTHTLDYAIKQLCSNIKAAKTNLLRGNIKRFKINFWRHNRCSKTIDIESQYIIDNKICPKILNDIIYIYNNEIINPIFDRNVKINYNNITDEYLLLIPTDVKIIDDPKQKNLIAIDPGLREFMTGVNEKSLVKIGGNVNKLVSAQIRRLNTIKNNDLISKKIKTKNEKMINRKIGNRIDDLHWKSISYLVKNYKTILLGNMSAKSIVSKNNNVLRPDQKVACLRTKYYVFTQRLMYKCKINSVYFKMVDESYTSKTCSKCTYYKNNLGGNEYYKCDKCDLDIGRDLNGARNIYIKYLCDC
jgi:transposase